MRVALTLLFCACASTGGESYTAPYVLDPDVGSTGADSVAVSDGDTFEPRERHPPDAGGPVDVAVPDVPPVRWDGTPRVQAVTNQDYLITALGLIGAAEERIRVVHYQMHDDSTIDQVLVALGKAAKRGVDVQVLLEGDLDFNPGRVPQLEALGCRARVDGKKHTTHAKLLVVDGAHALVGSSNLSWMSVKNNNETNLLVEDAAAGAWWEAYADALWADDSKAPAVPASSSKVVKPYGDGGYRAVATPLIGGATSRVWVITYGMNTGSVSDTMGLLVDAAKRGVDVRVLLEWSSFDDGLNGVNAEAKAWLTTRGVAARFDSADTITHAKVLLVDDQVVVGTNNWGWSGFEDNHETGALTGDTGTVGALATYFDGLWGAATP
ncbi:MAG: hypothetical protein AMXMBFR64_32380 [Myxococcales bacterium]